MIGVGAGIVGKVLAGIALKKRWVVGIISLEFIVLGWAMVGRGEFAFLVAQTLKETEFQDTGETFISDEGFGVAVWALLLATIIAPIAFGFVLASQLKKGGLEESDNKTDKNRRNSLQQKNSVKRMKTVLFTDHKKMAPRTDWVIQIATKYQKGLVTDIMAVLVENDIHLKSYLNEGDAELENTIMTLVISVPDPSSKSKQDSNVRIKPSLNEMQNNNAADVTEPLRYKDEYFMFDIDKYIERIREKVLGCITCEDPTVKIERAEEVAKRKSNAFIDSIIPPDSKIFEEGEDDNSEKGDQNDSDEEI